MKTHFSEKEIKQLKVAIKNRLERTTNEKRKIRLYELLSNINKQQLTLRINEISLLKGIIYESIFAPQEDRISFFKSKSNLELLRLTKSEEEEIEELDSIINLYNKVLKEKSKIQTLKKLLEPYSALRSPFGEKLYFSFSGYKIYKIGIPISKNQTITLEIDSNDEITEFQYINNKTLNLKATYKRIGTKEEVLAMLLKYEKDNKLTKRQLFIKNILQKDQLI